MGGPHPLMRPFRSFTRSSVTTEEKSHHVSGGGRKKWVFWNMSRALSSYWCVPFREATSWETPTWETGNSHPPRRAEGLGSPDTVPAQGRKLSAAETSHRARPFCLLQLLYLGQHVHFQNENCKHTKGQKYNLKSKQRMAELVRMLELSDQEFKTSIFLLYYTSVVACCCFFH